MDKEQLLKQITILDFMAVDLQLFLNTHPEDKDALKMYNDVVTQGAASRTQYETLFGPLVSFRSQGTEGWSWKDCPWPWEPSFNFYFTSCIDGSMYGKEWL